MGLKLLYSKLRLLTAENSNAYKMDVVMYDATTDPIELVFLEVKSSVKEATDEPPGHDKSIYASLFDSLNKYTKDDLRYDLTAIRDRLGDLPYQDSERLRSVLGSYAGPIVRYGGVCSIDIATHLDEEAALLATRKNEKNFEADLVCVAEFGQVADATYETLANLRDAAC